MAPGPGCHTDGLTRLTFAIIEVNAWNQLAITVGAPEPGCSEIPPPDQPAR